MSEAPTPVEIFCSYAHEDEEWREKLERHVSVLQHLGLVSLWHDRLIVPGTDWAYTIDTHLETASIILLLISADFFASNYCVGIEMKRAMERLDASEVLVIPILIHQVDWYDAPFARLQALPKDAKPLAAWQDEEMALTDVTAGIRRAVETLPLLAASAPRAALPAIWNIPYPRNPFFVGRDHELVQVHQQLQANQTAAVSQPQAISGLGGIGKTQIALEYAYRYHQDYTAVLWARAESIEALVSSYMALATLLRLPEREAREQEIVVQAIKIWLQTHRDWLLILDNADELTLLSDFLPPSPGGHLLLTTRATATAQLAHRLEIETLLPESGALLLLRRATLLPSDGSLEQTTQEEQELALQITQELGGLPLALDQAGAYLEETGMDLVRYWNIYKQHRATLLQQRRGLIADHPEAVAATWALSFQRVSEKNFAAAELLRLCAFLSPDAIPEEIFIAGASLLGSLLALVVGDDIQFNQAIEALRAYSLVRRDPKRKTLSVHRLVQVVLQDTMEQTEKYMWAERAIRAINITFPHVEQNMWLQCERLLPQALTARQVIEHYQIVSEDAGRLLYETASYLEDRARYAEAEPFFQQALRIREQHLGLNHADVALTLNKLANLYISRGKYTEAEPLYLRALQIREQAHGPDHPEVANPLNGLANLYSERGEYAEAELLYQRVLQIREQALGADHPLVAYPLNGIAILYSEQGKYTESEPLYLRALQIREQALGSNHPLVAYSLNGLANLYCEQRKYPEAEFNFKRALHIWEHVRGSDHPEVAYSLNNLANLYLEQGIYVEAEPLYQRALHIWEHAFGPDHSLVAYPLNGLANLYGRQEKYTEAEPLHQRALQILEQKLGLQHPVTAEALYDFALFQEARNNKNEAKICYDRVQTLFIQTLGEEHPRTKEAHKRYAALVQEMETFEGSPQAEQTEIEAKKEGSRKNNKIH